MLGCQPDAPPFWLAAAAIVLTFSFFGLLGFPIAFLLAFSHVALLGVGDKQLSLPGGLVSHRDGFDYMVS